MTQAKATTQMCDFCNRLRKSSGQARFRLLITRKILIHANQQITEKIGSVWETFFLLRLALVVFCFSASLAVAHASAPPTGRWLTANHAAVVQIAPCGVDLCGQIVGIRQTPANAPMPLNWQGQPQCGMTILRTAPVVNQQTGTTDWVGTVLDPRNGDVYRANIRLNRERHLRLHGYLGLPIFGQTQIWEPYSGRTLADCKLAVQEG